MRSEWPAVCSDDEISGDVPVHPLTVRDEVSRIESSGWMSVKLAGRVRRSVVDRVTDVVFSSSSSSSSKRRSISCRPIAYQ